MQEIDFSELPPEIADAVIARARTHLDRENVTSGVKILPKTNLILIENKQNRLKLYGSLKAAILFSIEDYVEDHDSYDISDAYKFKDKVAFRTVS